MLVKGTSWLIALALAVPLSLAATQSEPLPLGDMVKQPKPARRAARVITNDDLPERSPEPKPATAPPADDKASVPAAKSGAAAAPGPGAPNAEANARLAKRLADLSKAEESEQNLLGRLQQALQRSGMSEAQRQVLVEALGQSERALKDYRDQKQALQGLLAAPPVPEAPAAAPAAAERQNAPSPAKPPEDAKPEPPDDTRTEHP